MNSLERLKQEFTDLNRNPIVNTGTVVELKEDNYYEWEGCIIGASDSPYVNGLFRIKILFPKEYPEKSPDIIFLTPIYHLNVNPRKGKDEFDERLGHVSASFINWWKPEITAREILIQLYSIFYWPNPDSLMVLIEQQNIEKIGNYMI